MREFSGSSNQLDLPLDDAYLSPTTRRTPLPMQYLGSKVRLTSWILDSVLSHFPEATAFCDIFAGTGVVAIEAAQRGFQVFANDIQPYSETILRSLLTESREGLGELRCSISSLNQDDLLSGGREFAEHLLDKEKGYWEQLDNQTFDWEDYRDFCESTPLFSGEPERAEELKASDFWDLFIRYYANTYFGVRQCLEIDALRQRTADLPENLSQHLQAAVISVMTFTVSSTTHLAQFLRPSSEKRAYRLAKRRRASIIQETARRLDALAETDFVDPKHQVTRSDALGLVSGVGPDSVVYADPPYFKEHYSRYYHVLDTFVLYDYPSLTINTRTDSVTRGRYRDSRYVSKFGLKASVDDAFNSLIGRCSERQASVALSYADTSLVDISRILELADIHDYAVTSLTTPLLHSAQGQPHGKTVTEHLILMTPQGDSQQ